jgi:UDP-GlcNAc:undecaprenyl-phosphate GlcNAc-1-phosphate transferase
MTFPESAYFVAFLASVIFTAASLPFWRALSRRIHLVDDPGHRKIHHTPIPLAGGLAVMTGLALPVLGAAAVLLLNGWSATHGIDLLRYGLEQRAVQLIAILGGAIGMVALGLWDDRAELRPAAKFAGQVIIALLVAAAGVRVTLFVPNLLFSYTITVLWILTLTNAFNFMDNMNGLCAGLGAIAAGAFAWLAVLNGQYLVALLALLVCGALLGFLPYNFPRASAFLGDSGSHLIGFLLSVLAMLPHFYSEDYPRAPAVLSPLLILAIPLADLFWVVLLRWRLGRPFYLGDTNHLSHRLVRRGCSPIRAVLLIWGMAAILAAIPCILRFAS